MRRRALWAAAFAVLVAGVCLPVGLLHWAERQARGCFAAVRGREPSALPDCQPAGRWLGWLEPLPFVGQPARRLGEELAVRGAWVAYRDAAVGEPDAAALAARGEQLDAARARLASGTGRWRLDELGPPLAIGEAGTVEARLGERRRLLARGERWAAPQVRRAALRAALVEGDLEAAGKLARRYAGSTEEALMTEVAAVLCATGEPGRGLGLARTVEHRRARDRKANFASDFGAARVVVEACARLGGSPVPAVPTHGYAGRWTERPRLVVMRLRLLERRPRCTDAGSGGGCVPAAEIERATAVALRLLDGELGSGERLALLAAVAPVATDVRLLLPLAREGGEPMALPQPLLAADWLERAPSAPQPAPAGWLRLAERLAELAEGAAGDEGTAAQARRLATRAQLLGVAALGASGRAQAAREATALLGTLGGEPLAALARANIALWSGEPARARSELHGVTVAEGAVGAALLLTQATVALPDRAAAHARAAEAARAARQAGAGLLRARAEWLELVTAPPGAASGELPALPWIGGERARAGLSPPVREALWRRSLGAWSALLAADGAARRRAARYRLADQLADAPPALAAYLYGAARLLSPGQDAETWLDAVGALPAQRHTARAYAFARWQAARWRPDAAAARAWRARLAKLLPLSAAPTTAELWQQAGL